MLTVKAVQMVVDEQCALWTVVDSHRLLDPRQFEDSIPLVQSDLGNEASIRNQIAHLSAEHLHPLEKAN